MNNFGWNRISPLALAAVIAAAATPGVTRASLADALGDVDKARGVYVVIGATDIQPLVDAVGKSPITALVIASDDQQADRLNSVTREAGVIGQVTVTTTRPDGRLPMLDWGAARVIVDRGGAPDFPRAEAERVLRPFGTLVEGKAGTWQTWDKPRPNGMADWNHYDGDARASQHSSDTVVGEPLGLQWIAGPNKSQDFNLTQRHVVFSAHGPHADAEPELMARDAWSGLPLWNRDDIWPLTRFALVMDDDRVYVHSGAKRDLAPHTVALDLRTGKTLQTYDRGLSLAVSVDDKGRPDWRAMRQKRQVAEDLTLRIADGVLIQAIRKRIVAVDVKTGERLWDIAAHEAGGFVHPVIDNGTLYVIEGRPERSSAYTHWPMARPDHIRALDLRTGKQKWAFDWDESKFGRAVAAWNLQPEGDLLAAAITIDPDPGKRSKPQAHGLVLASATGEVLSWTREDGAWPPNTGAGHSHVRLHLRGDRAWTFELGNPVAMWPVDQPAEFKTFEDLWGRDDEGGPGKRPVGCTVWRSTPKYWYGGVGVYPIKPELDPYFNRSGRSDCDIGGFPANGLLFSPPNKCQCTPYLPGNKAYHSHPAPAPIDDAQRLAKGPGQPSPVTDGVDDDWPQWGRTARRDFWLEELIPTQPQILWTVEHPSTEPPALLGSQWEVDAVINASITQPVCAEGVLIVGETHRQAVIAYDPATGERKWRTAVDGRVDTPPSIHQGVVYAGTRNGYIYALARDTGEVIWRFFAAPTDRRLVVNGQLESVWPVFGSIPIDEHGLTVFAGRHTETDTGIYWYQLDPRSGAIIAKGRLGDPEIKHKAWFRSRHFEPPQAPCQNTLPIMNEDFLILPDRIMRRQDGRIGAGSDEFDIEPSDYATEWQFDREHRDQRLVRFGRQPILGEPSHVAGGWKLPYYADTLARIFAVKGDRFVSLGGGLETARQRGRGGDSKVHLFEWLDQPKPDGPNDKVYAEPLWERPEGDFANRGRPGISAIAVSDNAIVVAGSYHHWRTIEDEGEHHLFVIDLETGKDLHHVLLPGRPMHTGIALADGRIHVVTEDGKLITLGNK